MPLPDAQACARPAPQTGIIARAARGEPGAFRQWDERLRSGTEPSRRRIAAAPDFLFDPELIARVSPIEWRNVVLYGEINIDPAKLRVCSH